MNPEFLYQLMAGIMMAGAVYGGIRADIKAMHERITGAQAAADRANKRIDQHLDKGAMP